VWLYLYTSMISIHIIIMHKHMGLKEYTLLVNEIYGVREGRHVQKDRDTQAMKRRRDKEGDAVTHTLKT
jgi:hypothetical protein